MNLGETEQIAYSLTAAAPFLVSSAAYTVYDAAGEVFDAGAAAIYEPGTAAQELQFFFTPTTAGVYQIVYVATLADGQILNFGQAVPVTDALPQTGSNNYSAIYAWIRSRLQDSVTDPNGNPTVPNSAFDLDIASVEQQLFAPFPGHSYAALTGADKANASEAIGLLASIRLQVPLSTGGLVAPITYENVTTKDNARITRQTAQISNTSAGLDERVRWQEDADRAWARVSFVIPTLAASFRSGFGVSLPRRGTVSCPGHRYPERLRRLY